MSAIPGTSREIQANVMSNTMHSNVISNITRSNVISNTSIQTGGDCNIIFQQNNSTAAVIKQPIYNIGNSAVKTFTGRKSYLKQIFDTFEASADEEHTVSRTVAVTGLGGIGKTELCKQYALEKRNNYKHIIWINAENKVNLEESFRVLYKDYLTCSGTELPKVDEIVKTIYNCISSDDKTLIIFDNTEDFHIIKEFLPKSNFPSFRSIFTLINSRKDVWDVGENGNVHKIPLSNWLKEEAKDYVKKTLDSAEDEGDTNIEILVVKLNCFPLVLRQAISYIDNETKKLKVTDKNKKFTIQNYLKELQKNEELILKYKSKMDDYYKTVLTTFLTTFESIQNDSSCGKTAINLLNNLVYLDFQINATKYFIDYECDRVESENSKGDESSSESDVSSENSDEIDNKKKIQNAKKQLTDSILMLENYSIINLEYNSKKIKTIHIHKMIQSAIRCNLDEIAEIDILHNVFKLKNLLLESKHGTVFWSHACKHQQLIKSYYKESIYELRLTPLHLLAMNNRNGVEQLLSNDKSNIVDINTTERYGNTPFNCAILAGNEDVVKYLTKKNLCDTNIVNNDGMLPLHCAAYTGQLRIIKYLIKKKGFNINVTDNFRMTPFNYSVECGHLEVVKYLMDQKHCEVNFTDIKGKTPLHHAAIGGYLNVIEYLTDKTLWDIDATDSDGKTLLHHAISNDHFEVIKYLIDQKNCGVNITDNYGRTPLQYAAQKGNLIVVKYLIEKDIWNINATDKNGTTPLHFAVINNHLNVVKYLIGEKNCNVSITDICGATVLHYAINLGYLSIVKYLIENGGCETNVKTKIGQMPLHHAATEGHLDIVKYLIDENGCLANVTDIGLRTPLHLAAGNGHLDVVEFLINKNKCVVSVTDSQGRPPLIYAVSKGHLNIVKYFIDKNVCDIDVKINGNPTTLLHCAAGFGQLEIVKYFIDQKKCSVDIPDINGVTPLRQAIAEGHLNVVKYLIEEKGCAFNVDNIQDAMPLQFALMNGHLDVVKYLKEKYLPQSHCK